MTLAEHLNVHLFFSLEDAWEKLEAWRQNYNLTRPHSALGDDAPAVLARAWSTAGPSSGGCPPDPKAPEESCTLLGVLS